MADPNSASPQPSLRLVVLAASGQDLRRCRGCWRCDNAINDDNQDLSLSLLVKMILMNDAEVLTSQTLWSDKILATAQHACTQGLNLAAVLLALRAEAKQCQINGPTASE